MWNMIVLEAWDFAALPTDRGDSIYCIPIALSMMPPPVSSAIRTGAGSTTCRI